MKRHHAVIGAAAVVGLAGWYAFRPERLFVNSTVNEAFDVPAATASPTAGASAAAPAAIAAGRFHNGAHETRGAATIYALPNGKRVLRLTEFATSNGPDVHVYLVAASDAKDNETVKTAGFIDLSPIKGNQGDQNYELPDGVDLAKYRAVTIWCKRFGVNFGTAPLGAAATGVSAASTAGAASAPAPLLGGAFHSGAHETSGQATVYRLAGGKRVLRLTNFATSNGPDVRVYLVKAADATDNATVTRAGFVELGALKGNRGDQNYEIPDGVDLSTHRAVTIWCRRFGVNFGTAPLTEAQS